MNVFEASWTRRFFSHKHWDLLTKVSDAAIPVNRTLLCFPSEQRLHGK